jgi:CRISPR-associated protein Cmr2
MHPGNMVNVTNYTAITFAPVQGFIEKSRKLRDLYGASLILSYLSQQLVKEAEKTTTVISPALVNLQKGMPNRILLQGDFSPTQVENTLLSAWKSILQECRTWIERKLPDYTYRWEREWTNWENHTWEIFWGEGESIRAAMDNLETRKLSRGWTAVNWIGESSSLTGTDGIAFPGLGGAGRNPKNLSFRSEKKEIEEFYTALAQITEIVEEVEEEYPEGKFIAPNEQLSIPELVKRLVTWYEIAQKIGIEQLEKGFKEIKRKPTKDTPGQWTGWFMGDGDKVGNHLKDLAKKENAAEEITKFSYDMGNWGKNFSQQFPKALGRVIYAGGDDFLGIIYSKNPQKPIPGLHAFEWLMTLRDKWREHGQDINLSVGFVWVAGSVPQRDILQHCREAEKRAKSLGRDRVTIRIVFNSGQYIDWTCPWDYLHILKQYQDRDGINFATWECKGRDKKYLPNWSHVYSDLAQLKSRHAFGLAENRRLRNLDSQTFNGQQIIDNLSAILDFFELYFPSYKDKLKKDEKYIVGANNDASLSKKAQEMIDWIEDLITVGWYLCSHTLSSLDH